MKIPQRETEIIKHAYCHLHDAYHNIQCLYSFLKREYPKEATIEYTVLLNGLLRMQEIEAIMNVTLNYPVFGKEIDMTDKDRLRDLLHNLLGVNAYGYLDPNAGDDVPDCVSLDLHLYEMHF